MNAYDSKHLKMAQLHRLITILSKIWLHKRMKLSLHTTCRAKRRIKSDKQKKKKSSFGRGRKCAKITDLLTWGWEKRKNWAAWRLQRMLSLKTCATCNNCALCCYFLQHLNVFTPACHSLAYTLLLTPSCPRAACERRFSHTEMY